MHSLRNSPPDCFSQMLTHLEPRVSCTACNSLGSKPPPYGDFLRAYATGIDQILPICQTIQKIQRGRAVLWQNCGAKSARRLAILDKMVYNAQ